MNKEKVYMIFKNEYGKYSIGLSKKNLEGKWENTTFPVRFQKDVELDNKTRIKIKDYWFDFFNWLHEDKKGTSFYFFINDFEIVEQEQKQEQKIEQLEKDSFEEFGEQVQLEDKEYELPF